MKKDFLIGIAILLGGGMFANAQTLGEARVINPYPPTTYQTFLQTVTVAYDFKLITLTDLDMTCKVTINDKSYDVYADVYFDPEIAWDLDQTNTDLAWGNELIIDFSDEAYEDGRPAGNYTIEIPAGLVVDETGAKNPAQTIKFIRVDLTKPVSVSPKDGVYTADKLKDVTITFSDPIKVYEESGKKIAVREKNDWINDPIYIDTYKISNDKKSLLLDLSGLQRGVLYDVEIPEGFLLVGDFNLNDEVWMEYMNWNGMDPATLVSAPDPETSPDIKPFILTWNYQEITLSDKAPETELVCGFPDYGAQDGWRTMIPAGSYKLVSVDEKGNVIMDPSANEPANALYLDVKEFTRDFVGYPFEIHFPAALVYNKEGLDNPPFTYTFIVRNLWSQPEITAQGGVIDLAWDNAEWATYNLGTSDIIMKNEQGAITQLRYNWGGTEPGEVSLVNEAFHGISIDLTKLNLANGSYTLSVPQGYVGLDGLYGTFVLNAEFTMQFTWKDGDFTEYNGVESILLPEDFNVYDLNGLKAGEIKDLSGLKRGIYIVNGKKILVGKH